MHILASIGPNPASVTELLWHLGSQPKASPLSVHLVLESQRSAAYLPELTAPGAALDQLRDKLGPIIPTAAELQFYQADTGEGLPEDEHTPELSAALTEALWTAARAAQRGAGEEPVVFALTGGRRRASTALQSVVFQLLGRPQDRLVDVRLSLPIAEGGTGFFFPEQEQQELFGRHRYEGQPFVASEVQILVETLEVPRLRPLLSPKDLRTFADAWLASEREIQAAAPPRVELDLHLGRVLVNGLQMPLSPGQFVLYACLLIALQEGDPLFGSYDIPRFGAFFKALPAKAGWEVRVSGEALRQIADGADSLSYAARETLSSAWTKLRDKVQNKWSAAQAPAPSYYLVPQKQVLHEGGKNVHYWGLNLPADCVDLSEG
jgi:CRISPR-associated protein (TIGR02584 family)